MSSSLEVLAFRFDDPTIGLPLPIAKVLRLIFEPPSVESFALSGYLEGYRFAGRMILRRPERLKRGRRMGIEATMMTTLSSIEIQITYGTRSSVQRRQRVMVETE